MPSEIPSHAETLSTSLERLLTIFTDGFASWNMTRASKCNDRRDEKIVPILTDDEHKKVHELLCLHDYAAIIAQVDIHRARADRAIDDDLRVAERAKYLHLTNLAASLEFTHVNEAAMLASQHEALTLLDEYGSIEAMPPILRKRYLLAADEEAVITISREHDFKRAYDKLIRLRDQFAQLDAADADRYDLDANIITTESNIAMCAAELGDDTAVHDAFTRAHTKALENCLAPEAYFATYIHLLTLSQKNGVDPERVAREIEMLLDYFRTPIEEIVASADPLARFTGQFIKSNELYARHARRDLELAFLRHTRQQNTSDYEAHKGDIQQRWQREQIAFATRPDIVAWQMASLESELTTKEVEMHLLEARTEKAPQVAIGQYNEAIKLYEDAHLPFHAGEAVFEMIVDHHHSLDLTSSKELFHHYWTILEDKLGQDVMSVFDGTAETVSQHIKNIAASIRALFGQPGQTDVMTFQLALRDAGKYAEKKFKADRERQLLTPEDTIALDHDARIAFGTMGLLVATCGEVTRIDYSDHEIALDPAYILAEPRVSAAITTALATGEPFDVRHIFTSAARMDAIEQLVIVPYSDQVYLFHSGRNARTLSATERKLLHISVTDGLLGGGVFTDVEKRLRPSTERGWLTPNDADYPAATRAAAAVYWETLGVQQVTKAPYFVCAKTTENGKDRHLGGVAVNPLRGKLSYPQVFFGDDIFEKTGIDPDSVCEIGSLGIEALSRKWLPPLLFESVGDCGLATGCRHGVMVANKMVIRLLNKYGVEVCELGEPDIDDPTTRERLKDKMGWTDETIQLWKAMYFDRLRPIIASIDMAQLKEATARVNAT